MAAFDNVKAGEIGGWIEKEDNLSHENLAWVSGNALVAGNAQVSGNAWVSGNAQVSGNALVAGNALVVGNAWVSGNDFTTFYRDKDNEITVNCGCFLGKIDQFLKKVAETHGDNKCALVYRKAAELAKLQIDLTPEELNKNQEDEDND